MYLVGLFLFASFSFGVILVKEHQLGDNPCTKTCYQLSLSHTHVLQSRVHGF